MAKSTQALYVATCGDALLVSCEVRGLRYKRGKAGKLLTDEEGANARFRIRVNYYVAKQHEALLDGQSETEIHEANRTA